jgi:hypothetical protein
MTLKGGSKIWICFPVHNQIQMIRLLQKFEGFSFYFFSSFLAVVCNEKEK